MVYLSILPFWEYFFELFSIPNLICFFALFPYPSVKIATILHPTHSMLARVTIIGRPNVGKSSIFNSISRHRIAIISDIENTTRDIIEYHIDDEENGISYMMADSGGIVQADNETLLSDVRSRANDAINSSDLILFVLEYDRMTEFDEFIVKMLRRSNKPVIVVANKADNPKRALEAFQHMSLGLGDVIPVSAVQTRGFGELKAKIAETLKELGF